MIIIYLCIDYNILKSIIFCKKPPYRMGDMIGNNYSYRLSLSGKPTHEFFYNDSVATKYMRKTTKPDNFKILKEIIDGPEYKYIEKPRDDTLIIHLRVGDNFAGDPFIYWYSILEKVGLKSKNVNLSIEEKLGNKYEENVSNIQNRKFSKSSFDIKPLEYFETKIMNMPKDIKNVELISGTHVSLSDKAKDDSTFYINSIKEMIEKYNVNVKILHNEHSADEDFIYISNAKYFIPSSGGFSRLLENMVKENNGYIL